MRAHEGSVGRRYQKDLEGGDSNPYSIDLQKLLDCQAERRLQGKTQVIPASNPHVRNRMSHTLGVISLSIKISEMLTLNRDLCVAIATGHDMGHAPYGHLGEKVLRKLSGKPFNHNTFGVVTAQHIERGGRGLNLTYETLEGIAKTYRVNPDELSVPDGVPQEYAVVMFADRIAYTFADLSDAIKYGGLEKIPDIALELGPRREERAKKVIEALVSESRDADRVQFSEGETFDLFMALKKLMKEEVYSKVDLKSKIATLEDVYDFFDKLKDELDIDPVIATALLTDFEADEFVNDIPKRTRAPSFEKDMSHFGLFDILCDFKKSGKSLRNLDYTNPDLGWRDKAYQDAQYPLVTV